MKKFEMRVLTLVSSPVSQTVSFSAEDFKAAFTEAIGILRAEGILPQVIEGFYGVSLRDCEISCFSFRLGVDDSGYFTWTYTFPDRLIGIL